MKQQKVKELLEEAAKSDCTWQRRTDIQCLLRAATAAGKSGKYKSSRSVSGLLVALDTLYVQTIENKPEILPSLFPFFAIVCGDREEEMIYANVDWSL